MAKKGHKGIKKRVKVTKGGKVKRQKAFRGHLMAGKPGNKKRKLRKPTTVKGPEAKKMIELLGPSHGR